KRSKSMSPRKRQRPEATSDIEAAGAMTPGRSRKRMRLSISSMHFNLPELSPTRSSFQSHSTPPEQSIVVPANIIRLCDTPNSEHHHPLEQDNSIQRLKDEYLKNERTRSDPQGTWLEEQQWMQAAMER